LRVIFHQKYAKFGKHAHNLSFSMANVNLSAERHIPIFLSVTTNIIIAQEKESGLEKKGLINDTGMTGKGKSDRF